MPAEILVMCPSCRLPQPARKTCVRCGAVLPESPLGPSPEEPAGPVAAGLSATVVNLPQGRTVTIASDALELFDGKATHRVGFEAIQRVDLQRSWPVSRVGAVAALLVLVIASAFLTWPFRLIALVLFSAGLIYTLRRQEYLLSVERRGQTPVKFTLGAGTRASARGVNVQSAWLMVSEELKRHGVDVSG